MGSYQWQPRSDVLKCRELSLNSVMGESIQPVPWSHSVLPEFWTCEGKNSIKDLLSVFCMIRAVSWWSCLAFLYSYQALYQMVTCPHPQYLLDFLHGKASSFSNVCVLLTKAVGFIFKSLPLHFLHVLFCWTLMTEGHMVLFLPFYKLHLFFSHFTTYNSRKMLCFVAG